MGPGTPICNAIFSALLNGSGYDQNASVASGHGCLECGCQERHFRQPYLRETVAYLVCAALIFSFTIEKDLSAEQAEIAAEREIRRTVPQRRNGIPRK